MISAIQHYRRALAWVICEHCTDPAPCSRDSLECEIVKQEINDRLEQARRVLSKAQLERAGSKEEL